MKSLDFKRKDSVLRVVNEEAKKPKRNWDRIIYFIFLSFVVVFLGYYFINKIFFINADGQVLFENVSIRLTNDCRIVSYQKDEDDIVKIGDSLFCYTLDQDNSWNKSSSLTVSDGAKYSKPNNNEWIEREKYALLKKVAMNKIDITQSTQLITTYKNEVQRLKNEIVLDVLPKSRLDYVQNEIIKLTGDIAKLNSENNQTNDLLKELNNMVAVNKINENRVGVIDSRGAASTGLQVFYSPIDGTVTRIYTREHEVALKSEEIMSVHKNTPMYVKGFFNQEDLRFFKKGDLVNIKFPDGSKSEGIIKRFYYSTYALPAEFQKRYEPITRTIAADIYPVSDSEYAHWKAFYKMSINIAKYKY